MIFHFILYDILCILCIYIYICIQRCLEQSLRLSQKPRNTHTPKGTGERAEHRAPTLFLPQDKTLFFPFLQHYALSLARFEAKD